MFCFGLSFIVLGFVALVEAYKSYEGYRVLQISPRTDAQVAWVDELHTNSNFDFWSRYDIMVSPEHFQNLTKDLNSKNIEWLTVIPDVQAAIKIDSRQDQLLNATFLEKYYRYGEIVSYLTQLQNQYPNLVSHSTIGNSTEGRPVPVIKISKEGNENRPIILIDAGIHAREWIAPAMALYIIQQLVENSTNDDLLANADWHIIPLLNPDGYEYSHTTDRWWRKTRSNNSCSITDDPKQGVDGNRNFDFHWMEGGSSSSSCSNEYAGPTPFSEPETRGLRDYVLANAARIKMYVSLHSYGNIFYYPWCYSSDPLDNQKEHHDLASAANVAQMAAGGEEFTVSDVYTTNGPASGGSLDWMKGVAGIGICYVVELTKDEGFLMDESKIAQFVSTFFPAIRVFGEYVNKL